MSPYNITDSVIIWHKSKFLENFLGITSLPDLFRTDIMDFCAERAITSVATYPETESLAEGQQS